MKLAPAFRARRPLPLGLIVAAGDAEAVHEPRVICTRNHIVAAIGDQPDT
jgi:hypothetical protein